MESRELDPMIGGKDETPPERAELLQHLRSCENREFERLARRALERITESDVDFVYPYPMEKTLLDVACCEGRESLVESLLGFGADPNKINEAHNRTPLHFAAEAGHDRVIERLLEHPRIDPNIRVGEQTALHLAVRNRHEECARLILDKGRADPNIVNSKGVTPIHIAASTGQREMVRLLLAASKYPLDLDGFRDFRKLTTRDVITNKMPDLELPAPPAPLLAEQLYSSRSLGEARDKREIEELLETAARENNPAAVAEQLARKERVNGNDSFGEAAARIAVQLGHPDVLQEILKVDPRLANKLLLPAAQELGVPTWPSGRRENGDDRIRVFGLVMERAGEIDTRCEDDKGNTALHYAARAESPEAVRCLLRSGSYIGHKNIFGVSPLAHLSPSNLADFFDECLSSENDRTDEYEIEFDYRCLMPSPSAYSVPSEMDALGLIAENRGLKPLLKHPLLSSFLYLKWHRVRYAFYANFIFFLVFYLVINSYVLSSSFYDDYASLVKNSTNGTRNRPETPTTTYHYHLLGSLALVGLVILTIREILQFISSPRRYLTSMENIAEVGLIIVAVWLMIDPNPQIGAIVALLSAWQLVLLIGQHPRMSTGIEMFKTVTRNFLKFLILYGFLILAFALAFFTLFKDSEGGNDNNFPDPGHSLFKTIIMLTGEFDANDIPFVTRPVLSHCIFVLFVFLIAIVLFNLLNGLAVSDTAEILNRSELVSLVSRVRLVSYAETVASGLDRLAIAPQLPRTLATRAVRLFPDYLPRPKIAVKPYKSNEIRLYGRPIAGDSKKTSRFYMDPSIVGYARQVLKRRGQITENERTSGALEAIQSSLQSLRTSLARIELAIIGTRVNVNGDSTAETAATRRLSTSQ
ncbi:transient receptor potential cation channel protein painless [Venturia canescens]|uniref:transient receptor potential cation channel protein painless n=1 Tax=Venturia canescens TaxID=32260 RepID=UPI001C9C07D8|nr:transient receptor potential cation channel protein painless [Venturia canescens]